MKRISGAARHGFVAIGASLLLGCLYDWTVGAPPTQQTCVVGGCAQMCDANVQSCSESCLGGSCTNTCGGRGTCTSSCTGGVCKLICPANTTCALSCNGGGCTFQCDGTCVEHSCLGGGCTCTGPGCT